jgi:hypothetical protein
MFSLLKQVYHILLRFARGVDQRTCPKPRLFERQRSAGFLAGFSHFPVQSIDSFVVMWCTINKASPEVGFGPI